MAKPASVASTTGRTAATTLREAERKTILEALKASGGKAACPGGTAERSGLKRSTLRNKMRKLNIGKAD